MSEIEAVTDRLVETVFKYRRLFIVLFAGILIGGGGYLSIQWMNNRQETSAREAIFPAEQKLSKLREQDGAPSLEKLKEKLKNKKDLTKKDEEPAKTLDFDKDYKPAVAEVVEAIRKNITTKSALVAAMSLADFATEQKHPEVVTDILEQTLSAQKGDSLLTVLGRVQLANLQASMKDYEKARNQLQQVSKMKSAEFMMSEILLRLGLCEQKMGQIDQAKNSFNRVVTEFSQTEAAQAAKGFLRLLKLQAAAPTAQK